MENNRNKWKELLPVIQAYIDGKPVQRLNHNYKWVDVDGKLESLLLTSHRVKPENPVEKGIWSVDVNIEIPGYPNFKGIGTIKWEGAADEQPKWPSPNSLKPVGVPIFTPIGKVTNKIE